MFWKGITTKSATTFQHLPTWGVPSASLWAGRDSNVAPPIAVLGIPFDQVTLNKAVNQIQTMIASREPHYVVTPNVDFLVQAITDAELRRILVEAHLVVCDGMPIVWASRWLGNPLPERVAGADLVPELIRVAAERKQRLFFLGATAEANNTAVDNVRQRFPGAIIAGHYSPPFRPMDAIDHAEIIQRVRAARPDLLFVAFGCPKAEKWIASAYRELEVPVVIGVGATIDFLAGRVKRAPVWAQRSGVEWLYRLCQEPRRLFWRYTKDLRHFTWELAKQLRLMGSPKRFLKEKKATETEARLHDAWTQVRADQSSWECVEAPCRLDVTTVRDGDQLWQGTPSKHCVLGLNEVRYIDSTGVALLLRLQTRFRAAQRQFVLLSPHRCVEQALRELRVWDLFMIVGTGTSNPASASPPPAFQRKAA